MMSAGLSSDSTKTLRATCRGSAFIKISFDRCSAARLGDRLLASFTPFTSLGRRGWPLALPLIRKATGSSSGSGFFTLTGIRLGIIMTPSADGAVLTSSTISCFAPSRCAGVSRVGASAESSPEVLGVDSRSATAASAAAASAASMSTSAALAAATPTTAAACDDGFGPGPEAAGPSSSSSFFATSGAGSGALAQTPSEAATGIVSASIISSSSASAVGDIGSYVGEGTSSPPRAAISLEKLAPPRVRD
mmetsp:Transcript_14971/g.32306  ORF Transcript_14971/g.32306 Transcript_14971/m.32306 type:complete len:249 (+) Transcript_14971:809-1555(+)